jgi:hypothetical protein
MIQSWGERFEELVKDGQWLEALALVVQEVMLFRENLDS